MQKGRWAVAAVCSFALALSVPATAPAAVDLNGPWKVTATIPPGTVFFPDGLTVSCTAFTVTQVGTSLSATGTCDLVGALALSGTVDPGTGSFALSQAGGALCSTFAVSATASADSRTFAGSFDCLALGGIPIAGPVSGSRCGNGVVEAFEQCDDAGAGDCCTAACQLEPAGTLCADEGNVCTDDVCNGSGVCQHPNNAGPCTDGNQCTTEVCGGGACNATPTAAGTACTDGNACTTTDICDGAGACAAGPPLACAPPCATGVCDTQFGCLADYDETCDDPTGLGGKLSITNSTPDTKDKFAWAWSKGPAIALTEFGNPTVDTSYTACLSDLQLVNTGSGVQLTPRLLRALTAPAGSKWLPTSKGFKYVDKTGTPDGLTAASLSSGAVQRAKIKLKGKGANLRAPVPPIMSTIFAPPLVQLKASNGRCWDTPAMFVTRITETTLRGKGSPSGAFVGGD